MSKKQCELPFEREALEPYMSRETLLYHYDKHHKGYVDKLEPQIEGYAHRCGLPQLIAVNY